ncbi:MAG: right-handed parallel beta-helix repeat-containing protein, partial [Tepidisphaerales bacterium]
MAIEALEDRWLLSTIYVDASSPGPTRNGTSWGSALADLQLALGAAVSGDTIRVAEATYKPTSGTDRTKTFQLKTGVGVYGGYAGYGAANADARNVMAYPTILSGDIGTVGSNTDNSYHVVVSGGTTSTAVLDGFTITAGNANGTNPNNSGGGIYNSSGSPTIRNCTLIRNTAASGGGMYDYYSSPTLINCIFNGNTASSGGGIFNDLSSSPTLTNCAFSGNSAASGGGMYDYFYSTLINCTFSGNRASTTGGGIYGSRAALINCIVWGNTAPYLSEVSGSGQISGPATVTYSDVQGGWSGTGNVNIDPQFVCNPSGINYGDLRLLVTPLSLCVDSGNNAAIPSGITTDLAGNPRRQDIASITDTGRGTAPIVDMGAYEASPGPLAVSGGPYTVLETSSVVLSGAGYSDTGLTLS